MRFKPTAGRYVEPVPPLRLNIDRVGYSKKPKGAEIGVIVNRLKHADSVIEIDSMSSVTDAICKGRTITAGELLGTNENSWTSQRLFIFDIDNEATTIPKLTPEFVKEIFDNNGVPLSFAYWTFSNTPKHPKFRIAALCDEVVTNADEAKEIILGIMSLFQTVQESDPKSGKIRTIAQIDLACKNLDRMFLGTNQGLIEGIGGTGTFKKATALSLYKRTSAKSLTLLTPPRRPSESGAFDLTAAIEEFDLLDYILSTTDSKVIRTRGTEVMLNPCPLCRHSDDFYVTTKDNVYKCFSASNGTGGNIINYLQEKHSLDLKSAREMFLYEICGVDRATERQVYRDNKSKKIARLLAADKAGEQNVNADMRNTVSKSYDTTVPSVSQEKEGSNLADPYRELDLIRIEYDDDYVNVTYITDEKEKKVYRKSAYLEMGSPGKYRYEEAQPVMINLKMLLKHYGLEIKYNVLKNRADIYKLGTLKGRLELQINYIMDRCKIQRYKTIQATLEGQLMTIARENMYNPVTEYLKTCYEQYDGNIDYVQQLCDTIESPIAHVKKRMYIERFLLQMVWVACCDENDTKHHGEFVLTLQGVQGQGKTSWFRNLLPEFLRSEYFLDSRSMDLSKKDDILEQGTVWLCEMGEIAATFRKTDQEALKAYITASIDKVRPPYGKEAIEKKRRMSLCATTNDQEFLRDRTGDRRYAVIPCTAVNQYHDVDLTKLWAQIYHEYINGNDRYYFTQEEIAELFMDNKLYRVKSDLELALSEVFDLMPPSDEMSWARKEDWYKAKDILLKLKASGLETKTYSLKSITSTLKEIDCKWRLYNGTVEFFLTSLD